MRRRPALLLFPLVLLAGGASVASLHAAEPPAVTEGVDPAAQEPPRAGQGRELVEQPGGTAGAAFEADEPLREPGSEADHAGEGDPNALTRIWRWSDARVRGVFDYILPDTQERRTLRWSFQPRLGDLTHYDHIRFPMSLTYGFNNRTEGTFGIDPYVANPFEDARGSGVANLSGELKYQWEPGFDRAVRAATGIEVTHPLSSAPYDFNHGMNRYSLYTTLARANPRVPNLEHFVNLSYDLLTPTTADGEIDFDEPQDDFVKVGTGVLWRKKRFTYGLAISFAHTVDGVSTSYTTLTPSVIYDVPSRFTFNSPGQWQIGAAVEGKRFGDQTDVDFKLRVRWKVDFRKIVRDWRDARARARYAAQSELE